MDTVEISKLYCKRKDRLCYLADIEGNCISPDYPESAGTMCTADWINWNNVHSSSDVAAIEITSDKNDDDIIIGTTPEYFARLAEDEVNVQKATDFLLKLGIKVKTEYGNYRPTYDVLRDIGDAMSRA